MFFGGVYLYNYIVNDKIYIIEQDNHKVTILEQDTQIKLEIDEDYIYERSDAYKQIHEIYGQYIQQAETCYIICNNQLYIYARSFNGLIGGGELRPVVFKYDIEKDEFSYIGCLLYNYCSDIVNIVEIK